MHVSALTRSAVISALLSLPVGLFGQGLIWESTMTLKMGGDQKMNTKSYYLPGMFKQGSEQGSTIFRLDKQMMYLIDDEKKEYSEITFADLEGYVKKASAEAEGKMAELKKQLADMPEEQRKAMEKMMGASLGDEKAGAKIEVTKTPATKTISGYACAKYLLKEGEKEMGSIWTTGDVPDFKAMQADFREFSRRLASQMTFYGGQMAEAMQSVEGFPMETTIGGMTSTVTKVTKAPVAKSDFEVPSGYKKVEFTGRKNGRRGGPPGQGPDGGEDGE